MEVFQPINTQEEFNNAISQRLQRERETIEGKYKDYEEIKNKNTENEQTISQLQTQLAESKSKHATYDSEIAQLNSKIQGYETNSVKMRIALEKGLPYEFASRLTGNTEEEIAKDAENLLRYVTVQQPAPTAQSETLANERDAELKKILKSIQ